LSSIFSAIKPWLSVLGRIQRHSVEIWPIW